MPLSPQTVRRWVRLLTGASFIISGIISASWSSRIPEIQASYTFTDAEWGTVLFSLYAGLICGLPISSWLIAKYGSSKITFISSIIFALMLSALPLAPNALVLIIFLFFFGMARNLMNLSINTNSIEIQRLFTKSIVSSFHGIWSLSCLLAAGLGTVMITQKISPNTHFSIIALIAIIVMCIFRSKHTKKRRAFSTKPLFTKPDRYLLLLGSLSFCAMVCEGAIYDWGVNYFSKSVNGGDRLVTAGYIGYLLSMTSGRLAGDYLIAVIGRQRLLVASGILMTTGFGIAAFFPLFLPAILAFILIGFGNSVMMPIIFFLAGKSTRVSTASAIATVTLIGYCGLLIQPIMIGFITQSFSLQTAFGLLALLGIVIIAAAFYFRRKEVSFE